MPADPRTAAAWPYFTGTPITGPRVLAHQGGALVPAVEGVANTLAAFRYAVEDLQVTHVETDVRATRDGVAVVLHDDTLDAVSDGTGPVADHTLEQLEHVRVGGREPIPTLTQVLEAFPDTFFNIDLKSADVVEPAVAAIIDAGAQDRICLASFSERRLRRAVRLSGGTIASSHSRVGILAVTKLPSWPALRPLVRFVAGPGCALQVPERHGRLQVVSARSVRRAHALGKHVQVWTVDRADDMRRLAALGVDGIITDRPDVAVATFGDGASTR